MNRFELIRSIASKIENGIFVEIGTDSGSMAIEILKSNPTATLICVDPYKSYIDYKDAINNVTGDDLFYKTQFQLQRKFGNRIIFIRKFSSEAARLIPDDIDLIYIDGNHQYKYVLEDLELYFPKLKKGWICDRR